MKSSLIYFFVMFFFFGMLPVVSTAQLADPFPANPFNDSAPTSTSSTAATDPGTLPTAPVDTPIDGGLSLLIGAGVAYGYKKFRSNRKLQKNEITE